MAKWATRIWPRTKCQGLTVLFTRGAATDAIDTHVASQTRVSNAIGWWLTDSKSSIEVPGDTGIWCHWANRLSPDAGATGESVRMTPSL